ncbi:MAG: PilW family protein [Aquaspirillum sp.]
MKKIKNKGLTLVELLVGIVVGLVVLSAAGGAMMSYMTAYNQSTQITNLNQNMRATMDLMSKDIRRAGYFGVNLVDVNDVGVENRINQLKDNPFKIISVHGAGYSCIQFSYNKNPEVDKRTNPDPKINTIKNNRLAVGIKNKFGFKLGDDGVVRMRNGGDDDNYCNWGSVEPITDSDNIKITKLKFELNCRRIDTGVEGICTGSSSNLVVRSVAIEMTGRIKNDTSNPVIVQTLKHTVEIRNENY